jgi:hypothetical protein
MDIPIRLPVIYIPGDLKLPDNDQWQFRFEIHSETSGRVYIIAQNKKYKHWACSCPGWRTHRKCKHLSAIGVPNYEKPYEVIVESR